MKKYGMRQDVAFVTLINSVVKAKDKKTHKCETCEALITRGRYCPACSYDRKNFLNRMPNRR